MSLAWGLIVGGLILMLPGILVRVRTDFERVIEVGRSLIAAYGVADEAVPDDMLLILEPINRQSIDPSCMGSVP